MRISTDPKAALGTTSGSTEKIEKCNRKIDLKGLAIVAQKSLFRTNEN